MQKCACKLEHGKWIKIIVYLRCRLKINDLSKISRYLVHLKLMLYAQLEFPILLIINTEIKFYSLIA